ncbi:colanic acid/amylovoran biosynthesis glycosyltransferase [Phycisphaerales bacterium]|nr:colanic acid/amylovoran biosynthesis glycosyltransferase [Phycisphaerales bacterium]
MLPDNRTRVGYVVKMYPRFSETFIVTEILAHERAGLGIDIFSLRTPTEGVFQDSLARVRAPVRYLYDSGLRAAELWDQVVRSGSLPGLWDALRLAGGSAEGVDVYQAMVIALAARERGIGHLHAHFASVATTVARLAARMAGITYSFTAHAKDIYEENVDTGDLSTKLADAAGVVTVSDYNLDYLDRKFGPAARRVRRVYNGLDLDEFTFAQGARPKPEILAVGRLVEKKGFDDLLRAAAILRRDGTEFTIKIAGAGPEEQPLRALIRELSLDEHVELLGARPRAEVIQLMRQARVVAAPCIVGDDGNRDGLPTVLLEAMALGAPCIATPVTGIPELVRDGRTGLLTPPRNPAALASGLQRLLNDRASAMSLAREARALIEREFDIHRNTAAMRSMFEECAQSTRRVREEAVA